MSAKTRPGGPAEAETHLGKANEFLAVAADALAARRYNAAASNAAIAGINAADTVSLHTQGLRSASPNHDDALAVLADSDEVGAALIGDLSTLLPHKNPSQCWAIEVDEQRATELVDAAKRLVAGAASARRHSVECVDPVVSRVVRPAQRESSRFPQANPRRAGQRL